MRPIFRIGVASVLASLLTAPLLLVSPAVAFAVADGVHDTSILDPLAGGPPLEAEPNAAGAPVIFVSGEASATLNAIVRQVRVVVTDTATSTVVVDELVPVPGADLGKKVGWTYEFPHRAGSFQLDASARQETSPGGVFQLDPTPAVTTFSVLPLEGGLDPNGPDTAFDVGEIPEYDPAAGLLTASGIASHNATDVVLTITTRTGTVVTTSAAELTPSAEPLEPSEWTAEVALPGLAPNLYRVSAAARIGAATDPTPVVATFAAPSADGVVDLAPEGANPNTSIDPSEPNAVNNTLPTAGLAIAPANVALTQVQVQVRAEDAAGADGFSLVTETNTAVISEVPDPGEPVLPSEWEHIFFFAGQPGVGYEVRARALGTTTAGTVLTDPTWAVTYFIAPEPLPGSGPCLDRVAPNADLTGCDLSGADLTGRDLSKTKLNGANLIGTTLVNANLSEAEMVGAVLNDANLTGANLTKVKISDAAADRARFVGANLHEGEVLRTSLDVADFSNASLIKAKINESTLNGGAKFNGADLTDTELVKSALPGADFSGVIATRTKMGEVSAPGIVLADASGSSRATFQDADLDKADLTGAVRPELASWINTKCSDGTNSTSNGNTCVGHLTPPV